MLFKPFSPRRQALVLALVLISSSFPLSVLSYSYGNVSDAMYVESTETPQKVPPTNYVSGPQSVIVILVRFKDVANVKTREEVKDHVFTQLNNYFRNVSYGSVWLTGDVTSQWYQLSRSRSYYGLGMASSERPVDLIVDAVRAADREVNYLDYGYIMIVYAGDDQDRSLNTNDITSGGVYGNGYAVSTGEGNLGFGVSFLSEMDPIGPYAHYLGLNFRLPSLLNPRKPLTDDFVGEWDLMGHGFWANNGSTPAEPTSWSRIRLGWINESGVVEVNATESRTLDLEQLETLGGVKAVKLPVTKYSYYLIEVRRKIGYDSYLPDEGVLVLYIDEMLEQGQGIVRIVDSTTLTATLNDATFKVGGIFENKTGNVAVEVLSASATSFMISIDRTGRQLSAYLTVDVPYNEIHVRIDGANLTSDARNRVQRLVKIGSHVVEVPNIVYLTEDSRAVFKGWRDGDFTNPRTLSVNENATLEADFEMQYLLQVHSTYGTPTGSGWYDANTVATFSVPSVIEHENGTRHVFMSWIGDIYDSSSSSQIEMKKSRDVFADWKTQYAVEFTTAGLMNGTTLTLTTNGKSQNFSVPFEHVEWFDKESKLSFHISPDKITSGMSLYKLDTWVDQTGKNVTSPLTIVQPIKLTATYGTRGLVDLPSDRTISDIATTVWRAYHSLISGMLNFVSGNQVLLAVFAVAASPLFTVVDLARTLYLALIFAPIVSGICSVVLASFLLRLIYLFPISIVILAAYRLKRKKAPRMRVLLPVMALWIVGLILSIGGTVVAVIGAVNLIGFGALAVGTALLSGLAPSIAIVGSTISKRIDTSGTAK